MKPDRLRNLSLNINSKESKLWHDEETNVRMNNPKCFLICGLLKNVLDYLINENSKISFR